MGKQKYSTLGKKPRQFSSVELIICTRLNVVVICNAAVEGCVVEMTEMDSDSVEVTPPHAVGVTQSFDAGDQPFNHAVPSVSDLTPVCRHTSSPHVAHHVHGAPNIPSSIEL